MRFGQHTVLSGKPGVGLGVTRRQGALGNTIHAVLVVGIFLLYAVPVDACAIILQRVLHSNAERISPIWNE